MARLTDRCIFCETKTELTGEHSFWPDWSKKYVPGRPKGRHYKELFLSSKKNPNIRGLHKRSRHHGEVNSIKIPAVCGPRCNNGWMRERENITKPVLIPLITGNPTILNKTAQEKLALWIVMKAMVSEFSNPDDVATLQSSRTQLMEDKTIPDGWTIYIGHTRGKNWRMTYHRNAIKLGISTNGGPITAHQSSLAKNTYSITVGFGELLIWAISLNTPNIGYKPASYIQRYMNQIWPYQRDYFWPPGHIISDSAASLVAETLHHATSRMPWTDDDGAGTPQGAPDTPQPST